MSEDTRSPLPPEEEPIRLTRAQMEKLARVPPYQPGDGISGEEAIRRAKARTEAWKKAHLTGKKTA